MESARFSNCTSYLDTGRTVSTPASSTVEALTAARMLFLAVLAVPAETKIVARNVSS